MLGGLAAAGVTLGVIASTDKEETIDEKVHTALIRVGYVSEAIVMGSIVAIPTSFRGIGDSRNGYATFQTKAGV